MRRLLLVAVTVAAAAGVSAAPASAVCDPDYRPLCVSPCLTQPIDPSDPKEIFERVCPA